MVTTKSNTKENSQQNPTQKATEFQHKKYYTLGNTTYMIEQRQHKIQQNKHTKQNSQQKMCYEIKQVNNKCLCYVKKRRRHRS